MGSRLEVSVRDGISSTVVISNTESMERMGASMGRPDPLGGTERRLSLRIVQAAGGRLPRLGRYR